MTPLALFESVWARCAHLSAVHAYLAANVAGALRPEELLRAEWVARVSALDLYVHELVAQQMLAVFNGTRAPCPGYLRFSLSTETVSRIRAAAGPHDAGAAFDLEVREKLSFLTFQDPDKIADAIRMFSPIELWNSVAIKLGANEGSKVTMAQQLKRDMSRIVDRRNKVAHEGDLQPTLPREPWPISQADLVIVSDVIERVVRAIDAVV
jgi:hypothetical protein